MKKVEYSLKKLRTLVISDRLYLSNKFRKKLNYTPNFNNPKSFNEKVNYRMLYDRNPLYTQLADKLAVREYVSRKIGEQYLVPILATYDDVNAIDIDKLPERFVLKCNHDSGSSIICVDKKRFDLQKAKDKLSFHLIKNLYYITRERHYKDIQAQIICESYIDLFTNKNRKLVPETCRIHCFAGKPTFVEIDYTDEFGNEFINIYDTEWQLQPFTFGYPNMLEPVAEPALFQDMLRLAQRLVSPFDYCRADFLMSEETLYFSELTFAPNAGRTEIQPLSWDFRLGEMWQQKIIGATGNIEAEGALATGTFSHKKK
ncbi:ATP-grasp fold amidoligase family protein [Providencia vermicola]|uniref:Glycosyltransferase n=3 Tax=Providencia TaxID=586 RepID=A0AAI9HYH0_PROST|nr:MULTISPECIES: ATP-grasp fold amidoligase family protein [Providencia]ELR5035158.1 glycosyltransferase [Providencia stuartii]ELR5141047.1 glycosyltransferase [Providencia stuartii]ELR5290445.1 glycosyltransferase [Providencia stuartii]ELX8378425.1 glycosyltransferase [Providencia stuartii]ELZ5938488.1 glycosyltransferase [Providencia stuartii]